MKNAEFTGQHHEDAVKALKERYPGKNVFGLRTDCFITMEIRYEEVHVWYDPKTELVREVDIY